MASTPDLGPTPRPDPDGGGGVPSAHHASHEDGGSDEVTLAQSQVTGLTADLSGKVPTTRTVAGLDLTADRSAADVRGALGSGTPDGTTYLRGDGVWTPPDGWVPTYTSSYTSPPASPSPGETWIAAEFPASVMQWTGTHWGGGILGFGGDGSPIGQVSIQSDGVSMMCMPGGPKMLFFDAQGLHFGDSANAPLIYATTSDPSSGSGYEAPVGSILSVVVDDLASLWQKTDIADTAWTQIT